MTVKRKLILSLSIASIAAGACAYYFYDQTQKARLAAEAAKIEEQKKIELEKREARKKELQALYDTYLNNFTNTLRDKVKAYTENKRVLSELTRPINFETPELAKENYDVFTNEIAPALQKQINDIIMLFEVYKKKLEAEVEKDDSDIKQAFIEEWGERSDKLLSEYIDVFSKEAELISAYEELVTFYYVHSKLYKVDLATDTFLFDRDEDFKKHNELQGHIKTLKRKKH